MPCYTPSPEFQPANSVPIPEPARPHVCSPLASLRPRLTHDEGYLTMQQVLAACGSAAVTAHHDAGPAPTRWTIANDAIGKTLAWHDGGGLALTELSNRATGRTWQPDLTAGPHAGGEFSVLWNGIPLSARQATTLHAVRAASDGTAVIVHFDLRLADALDVTLSLPAPRRHGCDRAVAGGYSTPNGHAQPRLSRHPQPGGGPHPRPALGTRPAKPRPLYAGNGPLPRLPHSPPSAGSGTAPH